MSESPNFALPFLAAAQAQKHVTMNEALARLDALAAPTALSADADVPAAAVEGDAFIVPSGATGVWTGRDGSLAFWISDGWSFAAPRPGWRVWVIDRDAPAIWTGSTWRFGAIGAAPAGAATAARLIVGDHQIAAGAVSTTALAIPDRAVVIGVTARVTEEIVGAGLTGWRLGVAGAEDRYGSSIGLAVGSIVNGVTGTPVAYYADTPLQLEAQGGAFAGGAVRLAIHFLELTPPV